MSIQNIDFQRNALISAICQSEFKTRKNEIFDPYNYQLDIIRPILFSTHKRILINATSRSGKSDAVSIASLLTSRFYFGKKILIIAPQGEQTRIIKDYVDLHLIQSRYIQSNLSLYSEEKDNFSRLRESVSKLKLKFKNNSEILLASANIHHGGGNLQGLGADIIIIDESERIPIEIINGMIMRMALEDKDVIIICISNPTTRGFLYSKINDPNWLYIHIGIERAIKESRGRITQQTVDELKRTMDPVQFMIFVLSLYPDKVIGQLISNKNRDYAVEYFETKIRRKVESTGLDLDSKEYEFDNFMYGYEWIIKPDKNSIYSIGTDPAGTGKNKTIIYIIEHTKTHKKIFRDFMKIDIDNPSKTAGNMLKLIIKWAKFGIEIKYVNVDASGYSGGTGVVSILESFFKKHNITNIEVRPIKFGGSPQKIGEITEEIDKDRKIEKLNKEIDANEKARIYCNLNKLFENSLIYIPRLNNLLLDIESIKYDYNSNAERIIINEKTQGKSPDYSDALAIAVDIPTYDYGIVTSAEITI